MRCIVTVKPGSSQSKIVTVPDGSLVVYLHAKPHGGEANTALIAMLAKHFRVPKTSIRILQGAKSHHKVIEF